MFADAKTIETGSSIAYSSLTDHQVNALYQCYKMGSPAGYICWFRERNKVIFFDAKSLYFLASRCSLKIEDGIDLGTIESFTVKPLFSLLLDDGS